MADEVDEQDCWSIKFAEGDEINTEAADEVIREVTELVKEACGEDEPQVAEEA